MRSSDSLASRGRGAPYAAFATVLCAFTLLVAPAPASAQLRRATGPVMLPPIPVGAPDGAFAVEANPAAIGSLDGWQVAFVHVGGPDTLATLDQGDSFYGVTPLPFGLGVGLGVERLADVGPSGPAGRFSFAFAYAPSDATAMGLAVRHLEGGALDGATNVDLSVLLRPTSRFAISLVAHDVLGPAGLIGLNGAAIPTSFVGAVAVRPFGYDYLTIEALGGIDTDRLGSVGGTIVGWVPYFGRISGRITGEDLGGTADVRVVAGAELVWGQLSAFGGVAFGDGYGAGPGYYVGGTLGAQSIDGLPPPSTVYDLEVRGSVGERRILSIVDRLDRAARDPRVSGVLLRLRDTGIGLAYAQEIRQVIATLRAAGKPVVCHLEAASGAEIYACTAASRTLIDPAGHIRLLGPSMDVLMLGDLLRNLGVRADFVRIGEYKSAPERFTENRMSDADRRQRERYLDDVYSRMLQDLARSMGITSAEAGALVDRGPYAASQAASARLVQGTSDEMDLDDALADVVGGRVRRRESLRSSGPRSWGTGRRVGVVVVDGTMVDGENVDIPFVGIHQSGGRSVVEAIERLAADRSVKAIVLRVDSGGGSALASDQIWRAIRRAKRRKPVIASLGAVAASGGYYVASACDEIFADPSTLTGSIGIFFGKVDFAILAERVGVHPEQLGRGARSGAASMFRPFTDDEREALREQITIGYRLFVQRVAEGRDMTVEAVDERGRGRIWSGDAAIEQGLVDRRGGFAAALARARELGRVPSHEAIEYLPSRPSSLLDYVLDAAGGPSHSARAAEGEGRVVERMLPLPPHARAALDVALAMSRMAPGSGVAMLPMVAGVPVE